MVVGDLDSSDIHGVVDLVTKEAARARAVTVPGAGHMVNLEQPAAFHRVLLPFLAG